VSTFLKQLFAFSRLNLIRIYWTIFVAFRRGLSNKFTNVDHGLFGDGIYLSSSPVVAYNFLNFSSNWPLSTLGNSMGCLAVCEVVNHPSVKNGNSPGSKLPPHYILAPQNDHVRVSICSE
jgi:hypothetical protein